MSDKHIPAFQRIEEAPTKAELRIYAELRWLKQEHAARAKPLMDLLAEIEATKTPRYIIMPDALHGHGEGSDDHAPQEEWDANARLIAAEMYSELAKAKRWMEDYRSDIEGYEDQDALEDLNRDIETAGLALAKAEGAISNRS